MTCVASGLILNCWINRRQGIPFWDAAAQVLSVPLADPRVEPLSLIVDASSFGQLFGAPQKSPEPNLVLVPLLGGDQGRGVEGKPVRLTFMTEMGPFSVERRVSPAGSTTTGN